MSEPDIQVQPDKPPCMVNSEWIEWASGRITELESMMAVIEEWAVDRDRFISLEAFRANMKLRLGVQESGPTHAERQDGYV